MGRGTDKITRVARREHAAARLVAKELRHQAGDYNIARVGVREKDGAARFSPGETGLVELGAAIVAIERGDMVLTLPTYETASRSVKVGLAQPRRALPRVAENFPKGIDKAGPTVE